MKLKKIPKRISLYLLTGGASLIIGLLSFGGMFALWPALSIAFAAFGLSVAYEGEVYKQNIQGAWNKLFKHNHLKRQLANDYLLHHFPDTADPDCPQFFKDYEEQLHLLHDFAHKNLDKDSRARKKRIEKNLADMEKWFAIQLFSDPLDEEEGDKSTKDDLSYTLYEKRLRLWLAKNHQAEQKILHQSRHKLFQGLKIFSAFAGLFMGLGTTYLLVEAFTIIPFFASLSLTLWPFLILPMAAIAGTAYGLLTFNAVTDMCSNNTLGKWVKGIYADFSEHGLTFGNAFIALTATSLFILAIALTTCTAGTWWTVAKEARPLFTWMGKMPSFIMGVINPAITGLSAIFFNLQNTSDSLEIIDAQIRKGHFFSRLATWVQKTWDALLTAMAHEHWLQKINPPRLFLKLILMPLRILLFFGHLISIGVTTDRVPGISQLYSALLGIVSEGFEDMHYFLGHEHEETEIEEDEHHHAHAQNEHRTAMLLKERFDGGHGHSHGLDLPTLFLKNVIFIGIYALAAGWDYLASQLNEAPYQLSWNEAWNKQRGNPKEKTVEPSVHHEPSLAWTLTRTLYRIERHKEKQLNGALIGSELANQKIAALNTLQTEIKQAKEEKGILDLLSTAKNNPIYNQHRFFNHGPTETALFLEKTASMTLGST